MELEISLCFQKITPIPDFIIKLIQDRLDESGVYKGYNLVDYQRAMQYPLKKADWQELALFLSKNQRIGLGCY